MSTLDFCRLNDSVLRLCGKIDEISDRLDRIEESLGIISHTASEIKVSAKEMDNHIAFVTDVYEHVKTPFHVAINMVNKAIGGSEISGLQLHPLQIENKDI